MPSALFLFSTLSGMEMQQASPSMFVASCLGLPLTPSGEFSHPTASLQLSAGLNQDLSKGLIFSEYLIQGWQTDFVLFINSD